MYPFVCDLIQLLSTFTCVRCFRAYVIMALQNRDLSPHKYIKSEKRCVFNSQSRQIILNVYANLRIEQPNSSIKCVTERAAKLCGVSERLIYKLKKDFSERLVVVTPNKERPTAQEKNKRCHKYDDFTKNALRILVHNFYRQGIPPSVEKVEVAMKEDPTLPHVSSSTVRRLLIEIGFKFQTLKRNSILMDDDRIAKWRHEYLEDMLRFRKEGRLIYYLDETWVNAGHFVKRALVDTTLTTKKAAFLNGLTTGLKQPRSKGERLIILSIGSREGFVEDSTLVFRSKKNSADYHDEMNGEHFTEWMSQNLPKLKKGSVIVMDNASYHSVASDRIPNRSWRKAQIQDWLYDKDIFFEESYTVRELLDIVDKNKPPVTYIVDDMVEEAGLIVRRLPPYHCELNPIELVWSQIKGHVARNNTTFNLNDVKRLVNDAFETVTPANWASCEGHVIKVEDEMRKLEHIQDSVIEKLIINISGDTSSEDEDDHSDEELATPLLD